MRYLKIFTVMLALSSLLAACGGSDSSVNVVFGGSEQGLNGDYRFIQYGDAGVSIVDLTFDGAGNGIYADVSDPAAPPGPFTYKLAENGELRIYPDPTDPTFFVKGQTDGSLLLIYDNDARDGSIHIGAGVGKVDTTVTTLSEADLNGKFRFIEAGGDGTTATTAVIDVTFNGAGLADITYYKDSDGTDAPAIDPLPTPVTYSVALNGELTIDGMTGQINHSGSVVVFADDDPGIDGYMSGAIGFKENGGDLDGDYTAGQFAVDNLQPPPTTSINTYTSEILMTADTTTDTITGTWADSDGTSGVIPPGSTTYTVDPLTGNLTLPTGDLGQVRNGAFIAADIDATDDSIMIMFGIEKPNTIFK
jgi:hypothetical protein